MNPTVVPVGVGTDPSPLGGPLHHGGGLTQYQLGNLFRPHSWLGKDWGDSGPGYDGRHVEAWVRHSFPAEDGRRIPGTG
jgi:hypothetical protein